MFAHQFQRNSVQGRSGLVTVGSELVLQVEELPFELSIGGQGFGVGVDQHVAFTPVDHDGVTGFDLFEQARDAGYGGNSSAACDDGGMTGLAAALRYDRADFGLTQCDYLGWKEFIGRNDQRAADRWRIRMDDVAHMGAQPHHYIAYVGQSFFQILVASTGEQGGIFVQQPM